MSTQVLGDWHWVKTPSEQEKSEYNEMCMILMIKLKGKSLREHTENELNNVAEFLDAIIKLIESYPQEQMFKKDAKKMLILRMKTNYRLHHYNKAEKDCLSILRMLEAEKESFAHYDEKYGGIGALLGAGESLNKEIENVKNLLDEIRSHF